MNFLWFFKLERTEGTTEKFEKSFLKKFNVIACKYPEIVYIFMDSFGFEMACYTLMLHSSSSWPKRMQNGTIIDSMALISNAVWYLNHIAHSALKAEKSDIFLVKSYWFFYFWSTVMMWTILPLCVHLKTMLFCGIHQNLWNTRSCISSLSWHN